MFRLSANKIPLAASALLLCAGFAQAQTPPVSPLTAAPTTVGVSYQIGGGAGAAVPVTLTISAGSDAFVVDPTTVPFWLTVSAMSGTAVPANPGPAVSVSFNAATAAGTLSAGIYTSNVHVRVNGFQDLVEPVTLTVSGVASTLSVTNGGVAVANNGTVNVSWTYGSTPYPTATLSLLSSDAPTAFTAVSAVTPPATENWLQLSSSSGIAYNFGTPLTLRFSPDALVNMTVGGSLTGTVTITYGGGSIVINIVVAIGEPNAAITSIFPKETPLHGSGSLTVVVTGTGFGTAGQGYATPTVVSITYGGVGPTDLTTIVSANNVHGAVNVVNPTTAVLTIPWEDHTPASILNTAQPVVISITNGLGGETAATATLNVTASPIIYSVTDAAALEEPAAGATPNFAPYEMITIFGDNFGPTAGTPLIGVLDGSSRYPTSMTANAHALTVAINKQNGTLIADAYLLFATNNQINALVPSGIIASGTTGLQIVVTYNAIASTTNYTYTANPVAASPGIFTTSSSGQGQGAILLANFTVNSSTSNSTKALKGTTVLIYVSGLGSPNSTSADTASTSAAKSPGSCISQASYVTAETLANPATDDGAVILSSKIQTNKLPPCFTTSPTVSIGGQTATVTYAGWVADSVAGLYQVNATVPTKAASGNAIPVVVTYGGVSSQAGVTMAIQ
jgi:uncharacterized protein (TIGR03437 family)